MIFGPKRDVKPVLTVEFSVGFVCDGVEEPARPRVSYGDTVGLVKNQDGAGALPYLDRLIRRSLVDNDGTAAKWQPTAADGELIGSTCAVNTDDPAEAPCSRPAGLRRDDHAPPIPGDDILPDPRRPDEEGHHP